jgi:hypothetical protein
VPVRDLQRALKNSNERAQKAKLKLSSYQQTDGPVGELAQEVTNLRARLKAAETRERTLASDSDRSRLDTDALRLAHVTEIDDGHRAVLVEARDNHAQQLAEMALAHAEEMRDTQAEHSADVSKLKHAAYAAVEAGHNRLVFERAVVANQIHHDRVETEIVERSQRAAVQEHRQQAQQLQQQQTDWEARLSAQAQALAHSDCDRIAVTHERDRLKGVCKWQARVKDAMRKKIARLPGLRDRAVAKATHHLRVDTQRKTEFYMKEPSGRVKDSVRHGVADLTALGVSAKKADEVYHTVAETLGIGLADHFGKTSADRFTREGAVESELKVAFDMVTASSKQPLQLFLRILTFAQT